MATPGSWSSRRRYLIAGLFAATACVSSPASPDALLPSQPEWIDIGPLVAFSPDRSEFLTECSSGDFCRVLIPAEGAAFSGDAANSDEFFDLHRAGYLLRISVRSDSDQARIYHAREIAATNGGRDIEHFSMSYLIKTQWVGVPVVFVSTRLAVVIPDWTVVREDSEFPTVASMLAAIGVEQICVAGDGYLLNTFDQSQQRYWQAKTIGGWRQGVGATACLER